MSCDPGDRVIPRVGVRRVVILWTVLPLLIATLGGCNGVGLVWRSASTEPPQTFLPDEATGAGTESAPAATSVPTVSDGAGGGVEAPTDLADRETPPVASHTQGVVVTPSAMPTPSPTVAEGATPVVTAAATADPVATGEAPACLLGIGMRRETVDVVLAHRACRGLVMSANAALAESVFPELEGWTRVLGAPSLEILTQKARSAEQSSLPYEALGYGLETSESTPDEEWQDLVGSTAEARALALRQEKLLMMAPGFRLMTRHEELYAPMAALTDLWVLQTQQLQKDPAGPAYREEVERIVSMIRSANPDVEIWAQITLPPDREPDAEEWLAYRELIADVVDGTYIGVYTWGTGEDAQILDVIETIYDSVCEGER